MTGHPVLVIHGGTGIRAHDKRLGPIRRNLRAICEQAYERLQTHTALETVAYAVKLLEDDPLFNAGTGSVLQEDGRPRMSASIMDGATMRFAGVLNIEQVQNPVLVADALLEERDRVLAGPGATRFARSRGFPVWNSATAVRRKEWQQRWREEAKQGTVGAVALDGHGQLAAATSTGGKTYARVGRISDSGMPAGNFANAHVAVSCTGIGEDIIDEGLAIRLSQRVEDGTPLKKAFATTLQELKTRGRRAGAVALDGHGQFVWGTTLPVLVATARTPGRWAESF
jgi:L-asparaginase